MGEIKKKYGVYREMTTTSQFCVCICDDNAHRACVNERERKTRHFDIVLNSPSSIVCVCVWVKIMRDERELT